MIFWRIKGKMVRTDITQTILLHLPLNILTHAKFCYGALG